MYLCAIIINHECNGHLFQDRFLSEPVNNIEYFMTLMRYVHQNPGHAGLTAEVRDYPWSSWDEYEEFPNIQKYSIK